MNKSQETKKKPAHGVYTGRAGSIYLFIFTDRIMKSRSGEYVKILSVFFPLVKTQLSEFIKFLQTDGVFLYSKPVLFSEPLQSDGNAQEALITRG